MQDTYTKAGRLDDAIAVRARIRQLQQGAAKTVEFASQQQVLGDPAQLHSFKR
jgi:hypothetical protein